MKRHERYNRRALGLRDIDQVEHDYNHIVLHRTRNAERILSCSAAGSVQIMSNAARHEGKIGHCTLPTVCLIVTQLQ